MEEAGVREIVGQLMAAKKLAVIEPIETFAARITGLGVERKTALIGLSGGCGIFSFILQIGEMSQRQAFEFEVVRAFSEGNGGLITGESRAGLVDRRFIVG